MNIEYTVIRSDRRSVGIKIKDAKVTVRAPRYVSDSEIKRIVKKHEKWIKEKLSKLPERKDEELTEEQIKHLREKARRVMTEKTEYYSRLMGLSHEKIRISSAKSRFGSCSSKGTVCYSLYLMLYPEETFDLVAVHELCHLKHMNHSKAFYGILSKYLPDHKERKKLLSAEHRKSIEEVIT